MRKSIFFSISDCWEWSSSEHAHTQTHTHRSFVFAINTRVWLCVDDVAHDVSPVPVLNCELRESPELHTKHQLLPPSWWERFFQFFKLKKNTPFKLPIKWPLHQEVIYKAEFCVPPISSSRREKKKTLWKFSTHSGRHFKRQKLLFVWLWRGRRW